MAKSIITHPITKEQLKEILHYNPETGIFTWIKNDKVAGYMERCGYRRITITASNVEKRYMAHRLAWLYEYGEMPNGFIDHINRNKSDNRIKNLRIASISENRINSGLQSNNTSGIKGVFWSKRSKKWKAVIVKHGKFYNLGSYVDIRDAEKARLCAEMVYHSKRAYSENHYTY